MSKIDSETHLEAHLKQVLEDRLRTEYVVHAGKSLLYKLEVDVDGELKPHDIRNPTRGKYAFQTDILIERRDPCIPLVVVELKFGGLTTHDIITYSAKAVRHKDIYPYLRYGFIIGGCEALSLKFLTHNQGVDFAMAFEDFSAIEAEFILLIKRQIKNAEKLVELMRTPRASFTQYEETVSIC